MTWIIGIDEIDGLVFEGVSETKAHPVWPLPVMTPARFVKASDANFVSGNFSGNRKYCFREDSFDPISRIRRGRFYESTGHISQWRPYCPPGIPITGHTSTGDGTISTSLAKYLPYSIPREWFENSSQMMALLGAASASTIWSIINVETILTGEQLVTLKSRQSLGVLPEIDWGRVPDSDGLVRQYINKLCDDVYRAGPESVVDRAREAAVAILSAYLQSKGIDHANGKDIGDLIKLLVNKNGENAQRIVACAAEIPQRLHSRGKHAEQEKRDDLRPVREQDAELAVQCIGVMLCDLGWARWS